MSAPVSQNDALTASPTKEDSQKLYDDWQARVFKQPTTQLYSQLISTPELTVGHKMILAQRLYQNIQTAICTMPELAAREMTIANDVTYSKTVQQLTATSLAAPVEEDGEKSPPTSMSCSTTAATPADFLQKLLHSDSTVEANESETSEPLNGIFVVGESQCFSKKWPANTFEGVVKMSIQLKTGDLEENYATLNLFVPPGDALLKKVHGRISEVKETQLADEKVRTWRKRGANSAKNNSTKRFRSN